MKKIRQVMLFALGFVLMICACASVFAGCTDNSKYTVSVRSYDETKGTLRITPEKEEYAANEEVTIFVDLVSGYEIKNLYIGDEDVKDSYDAQNGYTFKVTKNTSIGVEFAKRTDPAKWTVTYTKADEIAGKGTLKVEPYQVKYYDGDKITITVTEKSQYEIESFTINDVDYLSALIASEFVYEYVINGDVAIKIEYKEIPFDWSELAKVTIDGFEEAINSTKKVLIDFYSIPCSACDIVEPRLQNLAKLGLRVRICKVFVPKSAEEFYADPLVQRFDLKETPTCILFVDGVEVERKTGVQSEQTFKDMFNRY